jgi:NADPH-dependent curcumin reductase CurA
VLRRWDPEHRAGRRFPVAVVVITLLSAAIGLLDVGLRLSGRIVAAAAATGPTDARPLSAG